MVIEDGESDDADNSKVDHKAWFGPTTNNGYTTWDMTRKNLIS